MANTRKSSTSIQVDMFQQLAELTALEANDAQDLDMSHELLAAITHALKEARKMGNGRERVVERMNLCLPDLEKPITLRQLNAWTAASKEHHPFPPNYLPAFCWATQCIFPLLILVQVLGYAIVDGRDQLAAELGNKLLKDAQNKRDIKLLQQTLGHKF